MAQTGRRLSRAPGVVPCLLLVFLLLGSIVAFFPSQERLEQCPILFSPSAVLEHEQVVRCVAFAPDGRSLAVGGGFGLPRGEIKLWDFVTGTLRTSLRGNQNGIYALAFAPDGQILASVSFDQTLNLWDTASGREHASMPLPATRSLYTVLATDGQTLALAEWGGDPGSVRLWQVASERAHPLAAGFGPVAFSSDSRRLALWHLARDSQHASAGAPDSQGVAPTALLGDLPTVQIWDIPVGRETMALRGDANYVWALAFSPDGRTLASAGFDETIKLWDVHSGRERAILRGHTDQIGALAFAPDGQLLASGSHDGTVRIWDLTTGQELATLRGHKGRVTCVAFAPDGQTLASGSHDQTVRLWSRSQKPEVLTK